MNRPISCLRPSPILLLLLLLLLHLTPQEAFQSRSLAPWRHTINRLLINLNRSKNTHHLKSVANQQPPANDGQAPNSPTFGPNANIGQLKRVCYFRMDPKTEIRLNQVDGHLCTHIVLAFARIDGQGNLVVGSANDLTYLEEVVEFKRRFPAVKLMISVFNEPEFNGFPRAALVPEIRQRFARSTIEFLHRFHLDGIDLDWEFPNFPSTFMNREQERIGLTKILKALRSAIVENFYDRQVGEQQQQQASYLRPSSGGSNNLAANYTSVVEPYLLSIAIAAQEAVLRASYELKQVASLCDWLNVMSYDYFLFKAYTPFTGPNSPLHAIVDNYVPILSKLSHSWTLNRLIGEESIPADKIVMGIPTYARAYRLMFRQNQPAPFTLSVGVRGGKQIEDYYDYREICDILSRPETVASFDERARVPYLLTDSGYTWISYESPQSVREKVRFALEMNVAGYMTWNLNSDDFTGKHFGNMLEATRANPAASLNGRPSGADLESNYRPFPLHWAMFEEAVRYLTKTGNSRKQSVPNERRTSN